MSRDTVVLIGFDYSESLTLRLLSSVLQQSGIKTCLLFFKTPVFNKNFEKSMHQNIQALVETVKSYQPLMVGMSVISLYFQLTCRITRSLNKKISAPVVWGGIHPTVRPEESIAYADIICRGEGVLALKELVQKIRNKEDLYTIPNLWVRTPEKIYRNEVSPFPVSLDDLPFSDMENRHKFSIEDGIQKRLPPDRSRTIYHIITSRGCPFQCHYCSNQLLTGLYGEKGMYANRRRPDSVITELVKAKSQFPRLKYVVFWDNVFTVNTQWLTDFAEQYRKQVDLPFWFYGRAETIDSEKVRILRRAGAHSVKLGIESVDPWIRQECYNRFETNEQVVQAADHFHKSRIKCRYDLIVDNPLESEDILRNSLSFLLTLPRPFVLNCYALHYFPETRITLDFLRRGLISHTDLCENFEFPYQGQYGLYQKKDIAMRLVLYTFAGISWMPVCFIRWLSRGIKRRQGVPMALGLVAIFLLKRFYFGRKRYRL